MEVIRLAYPHDYRREDFPELVLALGYFDGLHLGHMQVLQTAKEIANDKQVKFAVMILAPHPSMILNENVQQIRLLTPMKEKMGLFEKLDVETLFIAAFTKSFSTLSPADFVEQYIVGLHAIHVVAGFDYSYGRFGAGKMQDLPQYASGRFEVTTVPEFQLDGEKVSSTRIREVLSVGDCDEVKRLLGRPYRIRGRVNHGEKRGRQLGFPTANIQPNAEFDQPAIGVYAVRVKVHGTWYSGVCNLGYKPTFHENQAEEPTIEAHLFDFNEDIYGETVVLEWHQRIRAEKKFDSFEELVSQIERDKQFAVDFFKSKMVL